MNHSLCTCATRALSFVARVRDWFEKFRSELGFFRVSTIFLAFVRRDRLLLSHVCGSCGGRFPATWDLVPSAHGRPALVSRRSARRPGFRESSRAGRMSGIWRHREDHGPGPAARLGPESRLVAAEGVPPGYKSRLVAAAILPQVGISGLWQPPPCHKSGSRTLAAAGASWMSESVYDPRHVTSGSAHGPTVYTAGIALPGVCTLTFPSPPAVRTGSLVRTGVCALVATGSAQSPAGTTPPVRTARPRLSRQCANPLRNGPSSAHGLLREPHSPGPRRDSFQTFGLARPHATGKSLPI